jgi:hypothetical protein
MPNEIDFDPTADPFATGEDGYGRERCDVCRTVLYPEDQVRYQLVGCDSPTFCAPCQLADDAEAQAEEGCSPTPSRAGQVACNSECPVDQNTGACRHGNVIVEDDGSEDSDGIPEAVGTEESGAERTVREEYSPIGAEGLGDVRANRRAA